MADLKTVEKVAALAMINISGKEKEKIQSQLLKIIDYVDKLKELNVDNVEPMKGLDSHRNVFREDEAFSFSEQEVILENSPLREGTFFRIPKVID